MELRHGSDPVLRQVELLYFLFGLLELLLSQFFLLLETALVPLLQLSHFFGRQSLGNLGLESVLGWQRCFLVLVLQVLSVVFFHALPRELGILEQIVLSLF